MNRKAFYAMLAAVDNSVKVWPDIVPEGKPLPSMAYTHIVNNRTRVQKGTTSGKTDTWRVTIVANDRATCDQITKKIELLDGSSNNDFQGVQIISVSDEPVFFKNTICRNFVDIKTYDR